MMIYTAAESGHPVSTPTTLNTQPHRSTEVPTQNEDEVEHQLHEQVLKTIRETFGEE